MKVQINIFAALATVLVASFISISAHATMFEIACKKSEDDALPEFMILTENRVDYTFAAYTVATLGKPFEPRLVLHIAKDEGKEAAPTKTMNPRYAGETLRTVHYTAARLQLNSDLFADVTEGSKSELGGENSAQLLDEAGNVLATFICRRLN